MCLQWLSVHLLLFFFHLMILMAEIRSLGANNSCLIITVLKKIRKIGVHAEKWNSQVSDILRHCVAVRKFLDSTRHRSLYASCLLSSKMAHVRGWLLYCRCIVDSDHWWSVQNHIYRPTGRLQNSSDSEQLFSPSFNQAAV